jgi:serine/threonine protein kinase/tetratricopeptide (TPR) repeat protein
MSADANKPKTDDSGEELGFERHSTRAQPGDDAPMSIAPMSSVPLDRQHSDLPDKIGPYRVLSMLGQGGMGAVYKAEQRHPIARTVAIKIVKLGLDTQEIIARFDGERQALARMDHPNVARVLDAGADQMGRPYFVMEYVPGTAITRFADDNKLSIPLRLHLFMQVCDAIAHAHTKAIIHRDIKASNVLAYLSDGQPIVKVIDFGIAKALSGGRLSDRTFNTDHGHIVGTWDSMSPEQADGSPDIDTRTDVYALGVLLYELLSGAKPFDSTTLAIASDAEIRRIIKEVDPPKPSHRLTTTSQAADRVASDRSTRVDSLKRALRGELEWIPLKAMRKDRARRYSTVRELSDDVQNFLDGKPLLAGPESVTYRTRKFVSRNRMPVVAGLVIAILTIAGSVLYVTGIARERDRTIAALEEANRQKTLAEQREQQVQSEKVTTALVADFYADMLRSIDPSIALGRNPTVQDMLEWTARGVEERFKDRPAVEANIRNTLGDTYMALGRDHEALSQYEKALERTIAQYGQEHAETYAALTNVAVVHHRMGRLDLAEPLMRTALLGLKKVHGESHSDVQIVSSNLAVLQFNMGKFREAEEQFRSLYDARRKALQADDPLVAKAAANLSTAVEKLGRGEEAESLMRQAHEIQLKAYGENHPETLMSKYNLGVIAENLGRSTDAKRILTEVLEKRKLVLGKDHPDTIKTAASLADALTTLNELDEAEPLLRDAMDEMEKLYGEEHPSTIRVLNSLAWVVDARGNLAEAERIYRRVFEKRVRAMGTDHPETLAALSNLADITRRLGAPAAAEPLARDAVFRSRKALGDDHPDTLLYSLNLMTLLMELKQFDQAEAMGVDIHTRATRAQGATNRLALGALLQLKRVYEATGQTERAGEIQSTLDRLRPATSPSTQPATVPATSPGG